MTIGQIEKKTQQRIIRLFHFTISRPLKNYCGAGLRCCRSLGSST
jgi:hypothetical protein